GGLDLCTHGSPPPPDVGALTVPHGTSFCPAGRPVLTGPACQDRAMPPSTDFNPAVPAATVILLRDEPGGPTTLMLRRSAVGAFGGMWVFPGGRVDDEDHHPDDTDPEAAFRRAAVREAVEECALLLEPHELTPFSRWMPPPRHPAASTPGSSSPGRPTARSSSTDTRSTNTHGCRPPR